MFIAAAQGSLCTTTYCIATVMIEINNKQ